jgi:hypothetical protein
LKNNLFRKQKLTHSPGRKKPSSSSAVIALLIGISIAGCSALPPTFIPEEQLPTVIELTAEALVEAGLVTPPPTPTVDPNQPTETPLPSETPIPPSPEIQLTPTKTLDLVISTPEPLSLPDPLPLGDLRIINPGRLSRVRSPFKIHIYLAPTKIENDGNLNFQISLIGDDGSLLVRHLFTREPGQENNTHLVMDITFEISGKAETARLEVLSQDHYGRTAALTSTDLVLLSEGEPEIKSILDLYQSVIIQQPIPSTLIQGDTLIIQGVTRIAPKDELVVELINRDGGLIGSDVIPVSDENLGKGYRPFEGEIPFQVGSSSWIRVQVTARDGKFSGIQHISSVEVLVSP